MRACLLQAKTTLSLPQSRSAGHQDRSARHQNLRPSALLEVSALISSCVEREHRQLSAKNKEITPVKLGQMDILD
jgi:hypothetical protein